jgi:hypothetical protein
LLARGSRLGYAGEAMPDLNPLPDPVAYARGLSDEQLTDYEQIFGEDSREWIIARRELERREGPGGLRIAGVFIVTAALVVLARSCLG